MESWHPGEVPKLSTLSFSARLPVETVNRPRDEVASGLCSTGLGMSYKPGSHCHVASTVTGQAGQGQPGESLQEGWPCRQV